jgi:hypothetical protein
MLISNCSPQFMVGMLESLADKCPETMHEFVSRYVSNYLDERLTDIGVGTVIISSTPKKGNDRNDLDS